MRLGYAILLMALGSAVSLPAQSVIDSVVRITATSHSTPPSIALAWPNDPKAGEYELYRKSRDAKSWGEAISLGAAASGFSDTNVVVGTGYEYRVLKYGVTDGEGYLYAGIELPLTETR